MIYHYVEKKYFWNVLGREMRMRNIHILCQPFFTTNDDDDDDDEGKVSLEYY